MSNSQQILQSLKVGLGAIRLDSSVKRIALTYPIKNGNVPGARLFFKTYMPRLKFNNPEVGFEVNKKLEKVDSKVEVEFMSGETKALPLDKLSSHDICYKLLEMTLPKDKN